MITKEIWKDVIGYEGLYQVSNLGRIKNTKRDKIHKFKASGYVRVRLYNENSKPKIYKVHRLVALAFIPNPENKKEVNHINGIKNDNRLTNLEWCTPSENMQHAYDIGLNWGSTMKGSNNNNHKLTEKEVIEIYTLNKFFNNKELSKIYNVTHANISSIILGKTWSVLHKEYFLDNDKPTNHLKNSPKKE